MLQADLFLAFEDSKLGYPGSRNPSTKPSTKPFRELPTPLCSPNGVPQLRNIVQVQQMMKNGTSVGEYIQMSPTTEITAQLMNKTAIEYVR